MKKSIAVILCLILAIGLVGCSSKEAKEDFTPVELSVRELEAMPEHVQKPLEELKLKEGYYAYKLYDSILLFAARGELSTGGYTISFGKAATKDGKLFVEVNTSDPQKDEIVIEAITYPVALAEIRAEALPGKVVFVEGSDYSKVLKEVEVEEFPQPEESIVTLYFGTKDGYLRKEPRAISGLPSADRGKELVEELIKGTQSLDDTLNVIPEGTKVLDYRYDAQNALAIVDFSQHIQGAAGSMGETFAVYSVVNTLTELPGIEKVKFLVEGKEVETLSGHIYLGEPIERDLQLLEGNLLK